MKTEKIVEQMFQKTEVLHTLKLVPSTQRELFVYEMIKHTTQALTYYTAELKKMIEERLTKKREDYKEFGLREDEGEISALLEVKRMLSELNHQ